MRLPRLFAFATVLIVLAPQLSIAADYPARTVHFMVGSAPGGGTDSTARLLAKGLSQRWGRSVVVQNRPGADNTIAADIVAHAPPDGYLIDIVPSSHAIFANQYILNYDPVKSFSPITEVVTAPDVLLVNLTVPVNSYAEFIRYAKANPGRLNYGSVGANSAPYLEMELLKKEVGIDVVHVPFNGSSTALIALLGNEIQLTFGEPVSSLSRPADDRGGGASSRLRLWHVVWGAGACRNTDGYREQASQRYGRCDVIARCSAGIGEFWRRNRRQFAGGVLQFYRERRGTLGCGDADTRNQAPASGRKSPMMINHRSND
jgi:Tripartite tricarboxylate transporter family receptor